MNRACSLQIEPPQMKGAKMKGTMMNGIISFILPLILGLACVGIISATMTGRTLPLIASPRAALIALLIVGMAMCAGGGIGQVGASGRWASPLAILGYLLGVLILVLIAAPFFHWKLPLIETDTQAVLAVGILIAVKYVIGTAGYFFHWL
jgi:hypothetical protein